MASIKDFALNYSSLDRLVHRLAFGSKAIQSTAVDLEGTLFKDQYRHVAAQRPIFVTSLPRAGTTLVLEILHRFPTLATHTYRDMPFVMAPVLWSRFSAPFQKRSELRERAHGDGLEVGYDSPEAFEEVIWHSFYPEKYAGPRIDLWRASDLDEEARDFMRDHMKKIVALRRPDRAEDGRYLSKNNGNIARLELLPAMFPDATVLVPFRDPLAHASSLLRQHENFLEMHAQYPFIEKYMADIGHFEFGRLHKPIDFPAAGAAADTGDTRTIDYWLSYWIAAFSYVLSKREHLALVGYEALCRNGRSTLGVLCDTLGLQDDDAVAQALTMLREPPPARQTEAEANPDLVAAARSLHDSLLANAVNRD